MYRDTSRQRVLWDAGSELSASGQRRLHESWARQFHATIYPVLLASESDFATLYSEETGRPTWSVARMLGLLVLRELTGLRSDQDVVDALVFDVRWQHALDLTGGEDAYLSRRSLTNFRTRLHTHDADGKLLQGLFTRISTAAIKSLNLSTERQRMDSTFIQSNIRRHGRTSLMNEARERLEKAARKAGVAFEGDEEPKGWESTHTLEQACRALGERLRELKDSAAASSDAYLLAQRVYEEQTEPAPTEPTPTEPAPAPSSPSSRKVRGKSSQKRARHAAHKAKRKNRARAKRPATPMPDSRVLREKTEPTSIHSLHDLDVARGRKGTGFQVQIAETCGNAGTEILTHIEVEPANASDMKAASRTLAQLRANGLGPTEMLADAGYGSGPNILEAHANGVQLVAPVAQHRKGTLTRVEFEFAEDGESVRACPAGHAPVSSSEWTNRSDYSEPRVMNRVAFDGAVCGACDLRDECPVQHKKGDRKGILQITLALLTRDQRIRQQNTDEWAEGYSLRSGIEASNSELKRRHDMGELTVRGAPAVRQRVILKGIGCNAKRWCRALTTIEREAA